jgi:hypothetical protein
METAQTLRHELLFQRATQTPLIMFAAGPGTITAVVTLARQFTPPMVCG